MKTRLLSFKSLLLICVLAIVGGAQAWAQATETVDFSAQKYNDKQKIIEYKGTNFSVAFSKASGSNDPAYYTSGTAIRFYGKNTISVSSSTKKIKEIAFTYSGDKKPNENSTYKCSVGSYNVTSQKWTTSESDGVSTVTLTNNATSQFRIVTLVVTFVSESSILAPTITPASQSFTEPFTATISCETSGATIYYTLDGTDPTTSATRATYTEAGVSIPAQTTTLKACAELKGEYSNIASADYTYTGTYDNLAALKAIAKDGETYKVNLVDAIVTKVNGYNCYIQDATAGILFYKQSPGYKEGQKLNGTATVAYKVYQGQIEITSLDGDINVVDGADIPCTDVELADLLADFDKYESMRVKVPMAVVTSDFVDQNGEITDGKNTIVVYNKYKSTKHDTFRKGAYVDVIGYPSTFIKNDQSTKELNVWSGDIISDEYKETISVSDAQYATYYSADAFFMPEGMTGSVVVKNGDGIALNEIYTEGTLVPAKTALVLSATKGNYDFYLGSSDEVAPTDNLLHGTTTDALTNAGEGSYKYYKLSYDDNDENLGFYWSEENGAAFTNKAGKAYLALPVAEGQSMAKGYSLFDLANGTTTGIQQATLATAVAPIYDINGRRVSTLNGAAKGVYIVGGKKVMVK